MRLLHILVLTLLLAAGAHRISSVEVRGNWIYLYDENGRHYKTLSASSAGDVKGYSSTFFVTQSGNWIYLYDSEGKRYKTLSVSSSGEVSGVSGDTFTTRTRSWVYTWDRNGKRIATRSAR